MKKSLVVMLLCILSPIPAGFAQTGRPVAVTSEQEVEIMNNDVAAARTAALALAARNAVEKGFGTYIQVEQLEGMRQVLMQTAAALKYRILAEQKRGSRYWVKIQASVYVPEEYTNVPREERETLGEAMKNFVQKYPQGEINWGDGLILAYGKGEIRDPGADAESLAGRAAEADAKAHLLEIINDIPVDDRSRLRDQQQMAFGLEGFVRDAEVVAKSKSGTTVSVTVQAPIRGVKGLAMTVYGYYTPEPPPVAEEQKPAAPPVAEERKPEAPPPAEKEVKPQPLREAEKFTGLVIDARNVPANPAIFPKVRDTQAREVHSVRKVNTEDLRKRGMASYAVIARDVQISKLFPRAVIIPVSYLPEGASSQATRSKRRQGDTPLVIVAAAADGPLQADLIISEDDAQKIKAVAEKTAVLKECRVVIVLAGDADELEHKL